MAKAMPQTFYIRSLALVCFSLVILAEPAPKQLIPKSKNRPPTLSNPSPERPQPKALLRSAKIHDPLHPSSFESTSFSILLGTPLIREDFYEKRFAALGNLYLFSLPLVTLKPDFFLHFETGPAFSFARLTFENPPLRYSHIYLLIPAHFRLIYSLTKQFHLEAFAGAMLRPIEYDSRTTTDGGTHAVKDSRFFSPDGGLGLDYNISTPLKIRFLVGYLFLSGGMELTW